MRTTNSLKVVLKDPMSSNAKHNRYLQASPPRWRTDDGNKARNKCLYKLASYLMFFLLEGCIAFPVKYNPGLNYNWNAVHHMNDNTNTVLGLHRNLANTSNTNDNNVCTLCSHLEASILNITVPLENYTCSDVSIFMSNMKDVSNSNCTWYRKEFTEVCCDLREIPSPYQCDSTVYSYLNIKDNGGDSNERNPPYNPWVAPRVRNKETVGQRSIINVSSSLEFYALSNIDLPSSSLTMHMEQILVWTDTRLSWNISKHLCSETINVKASMDLESTEIWVPNYDLTNDYAGFRTFDDADATVDHHGVVLWRRRGQLKVFCKFVGVARIPFDTLGCRLLFHGVNEDTNVINYNLVNYGKYIVDGFKNAGVHTNYVEYAFIPNITRGVIDDGYIHYDFYFTRSKRTYIQKIIVPMILFTYLSFGVFLLDLQVGERLSYGMTCLLVTVAQNISNQAFFPVCDEKLWLDILVEGSQYFIMVGVFQSVAILWIYYTYKKILEKNSDVSCKSNGYHDNFQDCYDEIGLEAQMKEKEQQKAQQDKKGLNIKRVFTSMMISEKKRNKIISSTDSFFFYSFLIGYSVFIAVMFSTRHQYGNDQIRWNLEGM